jgi:hypothetical protein
LGLLDCLKDILVEPFMADRAVVALDIGVLLRLCHQAPEVQRPRAERGPCEPRECRPASSAGKMTQRWRSLGFVPLALLLVVVVHDLSVSKRVIPVDQVGARSVPKPTATAPSYKSAKRLLAGPVTEIPLYEGGDLLAPREVSCLRRSW